MMKFESLHTNTNVLSVFLRYYMQEKVSHNINVSLLLSTVGTCNLFYSICYLKLKIETTHIHIHKEHLCPVNITIQTEQSPVQAFFFPFAVRALYLISSPVSHHLA